MATYVLVPGAWLGGWAWRDVAETLRDEGHEVYPVTLTGLGERVHLGRPEVDLETHITDVVNTILANDLDEVILAGHSYAGAVVTGVADRVPERLERVVYVDSAPLPNGTAMADFYPPEARAALQETVDRFGDGWKLPFPGWEILGADASPAGISDEDLLLIEARAEPHPWGAYTQPLRLERAEPAWQGTIIACNDVMSLAEAAVPEITQFQQEPWQWIELPTGHWPMFSAPDELAEILDALAPEEVEAD
ncbi:MAG: alpha/beta hydrolase [Chloroflexota bacterium]|nr:alpha/beta hydrolase [Chloroflexota bacterium]